MAGNREKARVSHQPQLPSSPHPTQVTLPLSLTDSALTSEQPLAEMAGLPVVHGQLLPGVFLVALLCSAVGEMSEQDIHQQRLHYDLFEASSYNNLIRPVVNTSESLQINFTLVLSAIINVDSKNQVIITNVWLQMGWHDYQLTWNSSEYGGITQIMINHTKVWVPDVVLFNNADGNFEVSYNPNCVLQDSGNLTFIPPAIYTSSCKIDVMYFPFDQQNCEMKFGSWTFGGKTLTYLLNETKIVMDDYMKNGAWDIIGGHGRTEHVKDISTRELKEMIVYVLVLRRKTLFYTVNLIIPCFLHALACLCVFVLPAGKGKKITLVANVLVSLVVFLLLLQKILPPSLSTPLIAKYFIFTFIMNVLEILIAILIIFAHNRTPRMAIMPRWICWLFLYKMPKYLLMTRPDHDNRWQPKRCTPPPSYPDTPQVTRANITIHQTCRDSKRKSARLRELLSTGLDSRDAQRVMEWRHKFSQSHSHGLSGATMSSSTSGSSFSIDEIPPIDMRRFEPPNIPVNEHNCCLRDSGTSQSEESLDGEKISHDAVKSGNAQITRASLLVLTKEIYSACNAIKFICNQTRNKEAYNMVLDDWKFLAAVIDRLLMIIFVLVSISGTLHVLLNVPHVVSSES